MKTFRPVPFSQVDIHMGFWQQRQQLNRRVTVPAVMRQFQKTGRFDALRCDWREGMPNRPHIFWDSDIAKWIESVAFLIEKQPEPELEQVVEDAIDEMERHQGADGYLNSYFTGVEPVKRWHLRWAHELYCAGHLMEAAVAWKRATGRDRFLKIMCRYADYIDRVFREEKSASFATPGHEEIELALVKLYHATGEEKYLNLSRYFIDQRGRAPQDDEPEAWQRRMNQSHLPCTEQETAEGHAVRACYLYSGMADIAREYGDERLKAACEKLFDNIIQRRMYITGGIGSTHLQEAFTIDYDLPNETAYTETCAAISLCFFAQRMLLLSPERKYADVIERVLYNGFLSSTSLDGKEFFYCNPMELNIRHRFAHPSSSEGDWLPDAQRVEVFGCSCCPPNITRFVASLGDYLYTQDEQGLFVHQYVGHRASIDGGTLEMRTEYPLNGEIHIHVKGMAGKKLRLRIPEWCDSFRLDAPYAMENGYAVVTLGEDTELRLDLDMQPRLMEGHPYIADTVGKAALMRGPVVYCLEGVDNGEHLEDCFVALPGAFREEYRAEYGLPVIHAEGWRLADCQENWLYRPLKDAWESQPLHFIPYFAFANRGESDMRVWIPVKR